MAHLVEVTHSVLVRRSTRERRHVESRSVRRSFAACGAISALWLFAAVPVRAATAAKTVVLVHGAFADGSSWGKVIPLLLAKGLKVVALRSAPKHPLSLGA